jgi:rhodanese-related sulfurtransferase
LNPFKEKIMPQVSARILANTAQPAEAQRYLALKLSLEANVAEVYEAQQAKEAGLVIVDARNAESFAEGHIPGSINLNAKDITVASVASLDKNAVYVTYCGGPACNASTKAAEKLAGFGFKVKEFSGGLPKWQEKGYPVQTGA